MRKKRRSQDPFDEFLRRFLEELEEEMERLREMWDIDFFKEWERIMERMPKEREGKPIVYGFSIKMGPEGPIIEEFGNVKKGEILNEREPLVDVINREKEITILAEMPGVKKEDINIDVKPKELIVRVPGKFFKRIQLPDEVDPEKVRAKYNNGVLEVVLKKTARKRVRVE